MKNSVKICCFIAELGSNPITSTNTTDNVMAACRKCTLVVQVRLLVSGFLLHSSNGSGRLPFGQKIRVRFPYGVPFQTLTVSDSNV